MGHWDAELSDLLAHRGRALVGYAYVLCGDRQEAEDLVQEALVRVFSRWRRRTQGPTSGAVRVDTSGGGTESYVRTTILNLYLDGYRRRRRYTAVQHTLLVDDATAGPASGVAVRADVALALAGLSARQRACVVLRYFEDMTVPQVAAALGLADGTVKKYLHEAMGSLRGVLGAPTQPVPVVPVDVPADRLDARVTDLLTDQRTEVA